MSAWNLDTIKERFADFVREREAGNRGIKIGAAVGLIGISLLVGTASFWTSRHATLPDVFQKLGVGDVDAVSSLVASDTSVLQAVDFDGNQPLHVAVSAGSVDLTRTLLDAGADANAANRTGLPPLAAALEAEGHQVQIVRLLLDHGASASVVLANGETLLHRAAALPKVDPRVVKLLAPKPEAMVARDSKGRTPLDVARERGQLKLFSGLTKGSAAMADAK